MDVPDRIASPETLRITARLVEIVEALRTIAAPLDDRASALASLDSPEAREARRVVEDLAAVMAWHVECLNDYLELLDGPVVPSRPLAAPHDASAGRRAASSQFFTDAKALDTLSAAYDALSEAALRAGDAGTALVARQGIAEIAPLWTRLTDLVPTFVAAEFRAMTRALG